MKKFLCATFYCLSIVSASNAQWHTRYTFNEERPLTNQFKLKVISQDTLLMYPFYTYNDTNIMRSVDAGITWTKQSLPETLIGTFLQSCEFPSSNIGYIAGGAAFGDWNVLLKTTDAGASWNKITIDLLSSSGTQVIDNISFVNDNIGYIHAGKYLLKTIDGAENFESVTIPTLDDSMYATITDIKFISENIGFLYIIYNTVANPTYQSMVYKTNNGGARWYVVDRNEIAVAQDWNIHDLIFSVDDEHLITIGHKGYIKISHDGGEHWMMKALPDTTLSATEVYFVNNSCGYIIQNKNMYRTGNDGNTWTVQSISSDTAQVDFVEFANDSIGYASAAQLLFEDPYSILFHTHQNAAAPIHTINPTLKNLIQIFPNPASGMIQIRYGSPFTIEQLYMTDISGKIIKHFDTYATQLSVESIPAGMYFLHLQTTEGALVDKIIIAH